MSTDGRKHWSAERRQRHSLRQRAIWAQRKRGTRQPPVRNVQRPWLDIFEECLNALRVRLRQFTVIEETVGRLSEGDDNCENVGGLAAQHAMHLRVALQALDSVVDTQRQLAQRKVDRKHASGPGE